MMYIRCAWHGLAVAIAGFEEQGAPVIENSEGITGPIVDELPAKTHW